MSKHNTNMSLESSDRKWLADKAEELGLKGGRSELVSLMIKKASKDHDFVKECCRLQGMTPEEAELKELEYWGLV